MANPFHDDPLYGHPWQGEVAREAKRRARHARWRSSLSARDWGRILAMAREVTASYSPARLDDLDAAGIAVGVCLVGHERWLSGERIGTVLGGTVAVLVWLK